MSFGTAPLASTIFQTPTGGGTGASNANGGSALDSSGGKLLTLSGAMANGVTTGSFAVSDNYGNSWSLAIDVSGSSNFGSFVFYCKNPTVGTGHVVTFSCSIGTFATCVFDVWADGDASAPLDITNSGTGSTNPILPGSVTPANANSLILTALSLGTDPSVPFFIVDTAYDPNISYASINTLGNAYGGARSFIVETAIVAQNPDWNTNNGLASAVIAVFKPATGGGVTGTAAWTEANDTWAGSGGVLVSGTAAWTEGNDLWSGSGGVLVSGTAAWTEGNDVWAGSGTVASGTTGTAAWVEGNDTWAGSGGVLVSGTAAWVEGNDIWAGIGNATQPAATGTAAWTEANDNWAGVGSNGAVTVGGHFIPTRKELAALKKRALKEDKRRKREDEDKAKEQDTIAAEMRALLHPAPKQQTKAVELPDDDETEELELLLLYG